VITKQDIADIFQNQLKVRGVTVPYEVLLDAAAQVAQCLVCDANERKEPSDEVAP